MKIGDMVRVLWPTPHGDFYTTGLIVDTMNMEDGWPMYEIQTSEHGIGWFSDVEMKLVSSSKDQDESWRHRKSTHEKP